MAEDGFTLKISGFAEAMAELRKMPAAIQSKILKGATATAASVFRKEAILRAPMYTGEISAGHPPPGTLKKAIYQARMSYACTSTTEVWKVGVRFGKGKATKKGVSLDAYYASWVENGHYARGPKGQSRASAKKAQKVGDVRWVPAHPFMRPAFETQKQAAVKAFADYVYTNIGYALDGMKFIRSIQ